MFCVFISISNAQNPPGQVYFRAIGNDSINLPLTYEYYLIEDSCAQMIRYSRFNFNERKFFGKFKDVSKENPNLIVSEGAYSSDGLKDGPFTIRYLNGNLRAKGNFKDDKYDGKWAMYYDDGKPELTFEMAGDECQIIDAWDADGTKEVDNGNGLYINSFGAYYWIGRLSNGKPDGTWKQLKTDNTDNVATATEHFKNGVFHDGSNRMTDYYKDVSRIKFTVPLKLPLINAEKLYLSPGSCTPVQSAPIQTRHIVGAQYKDGLKVFSSYISDAVTPYLRRLNRNMINIRAEISGEVAENGTIINLDYNRSYYPDIARPLSVQLRNLPPLQPATVDGKPVKQKFTISFTISGGAFSFTYRFLDIEDK